MKDALKNDIEVIDEKIKDSIADSIMKEEEETEEPITRFMRNKISHEKKVIKKRRMKNELARKARRINRKRKNK